MPMEDRFAIRSNTNVSPKSRSTDYLRRPGLAGLALALLLFALLVSAVPQLRAGEPEVGPQALEPPTTGGVVALDRALAKLSTHKRLLVIAAHPDDEDTSLLSLVARGLGGESAYLSLSRGEGGQNLIGPELGVGLGLVRSRELLAARSIDGARQFFTRAYDFGYTRSLEETFTLWPREVLQEDVARVIRRFRPQVVVSIFPGQPVRTHGQHQAAGVVAHEVFETVGEPGAFPQLDAEGLPPWQPNALYRSTFFDRASTTLEMPVGTVDPLTGKSIFQLAMASRSQHRSQDMGVLQPLGSRSTQLSWERGAGGVEASQVFDGIDTSLAGMVSTLPADGPGGEVRKAVTELLDRAETRAREIRAALVPTDLAAAVPALQEIVTDLRQAHDLLAESRIDNDALDREALAIARILDEKLQVAEEALVAAAGVAVDVFAAEETLVPGEEVEVEALVWNADGPRDGTSDGAPAVELKDTQIVTESGLAEDGWPVRPAPEEEDQGRGFFGIEPTLSAPGTLHRGDLYQGRFLLGVPTDAEPSMPYFLRRPLRGALYDWSTVAPELRGEPFDPPRVRMLFTLELAGTEVRLEREVVSRFRDQARGEVRRPLRVVPPVEVAVAPDLLVWPTGEGQPRRLEVTLTSHRSQPVSGHLEVTVPEGWPSVAPVPFELRETEAPETAILELQPPTDFPRGRYRVAVSAVAEGAGNGDKERFELAVPLVDYEHIQPTPWPQPAAVKISAAEIRIPPLDRVGYVRGASDRVPEFLREIGVPLELISPRDLSNGSLDGFDAVVIGSRAYETEPALARTNGKLLDYVRRGGLLIVQYQQYQFARGGFAPFPLDISRPHDRVTDETAAVRVLHPDHPVLHVPNEIGEDDWQGWVQERGLYFAGTWDAAYTPLLAMADPGGEEVQGSLLVAPLGEGTYVYTGLAFFRQLPAGVPGGYRLFANLLGLAPGGSG